MKCISILLFALLLSTGCKKENIQKQISITGNWELSKVGGSQLSSGSGYTITFNADNTYRMVLYPSRSILTGNYSLGSPNSSGVINLVFYPDTRPSYSNQIQLTEYSLYFIGIDYIDITSSYYIKI